MSGIIEQCLRDPHFCSTYRSHCTNDSISTQPTLTSGSGPSDAEKYGYGTLAVAIISICPIVSVAVAGFRKSSSYKYIISAMLGLCVGSLSGDALLHLVPAVFGLHSHSVSSHHHREDKRDHHHHGNDDHGHHHHGNDDHGHHHHGNDDDDHHHQQHDQTYLWKMFCVCASLWGFLILQMAIQGAGKVMERRRQRKQENVDSIHFSNGGLTVESESNVQIVSVVERSIPSSEVIKDKHEHFSDDGLDVHAHSSVAWMVTIGDALHNFTDGLAIGAAFSHSTFSGLATSIAIFCHELPHEFGDAALMLSAGWSYKLVLLLQCLAQVTAFVGLYIGIALSNAFEDAQMWIFAIAAGMFLYVALCDAVPEMFELAHRHGCLCIGLLSNFGIGVALMLMILLAVYEEDIHDSLHQ